MRVVLSFPVLQGNGAIKCSRTPAGTPSLHFSSLKFILLHSFVAHCTRASYPCTPIHVYLQSSSKHKFYTGWLLHSLVAQYSSSVGATPPNPPGMVFSRQAPQLWQCCFSFFWPNRQMLLCQGLQHTSKKRVTGNQSLAKNEESSKFVRANMYHHSFINYKKSKDPLGTSWRPFESLDLVCCALQALRLCDPRRWTLLIGLLSLYFEADLAG